MCYACMVKKQLITNHDIIYVLGPTKPVTNSTSGDDEWVAIVASYVKYKGRATGQHGAE